MASNRERQRKSRYIWGLLRRLGHNNLRLENDPLGGRYDVNKFGIHAHLEGTEAEGSESVRKRITEIRDAFIDKLLNEGWEIAYGKRRETVSLQHLDSEASISIGAVMMMPVGIEARFTIGVH